MASTNKIEFRTAYSGQIRHTCPSGRPTADQYGYEIDKYGRKIIVKTGETNVYEKIQAALEETKIENIIERCVQGDTSMLRANGQYIDTTELPNNMIEARQAMQNLENVWGALPRDIKEKYHFDVDEFIGASGSDSWLRDMGLLEPEIKPSPINETPVIEEVPENE